MADNQSSLNENLIAAGLNTSNPTSTYVDFAEQVAKNQAEQAQQEQSLALAKEHVKQAQFTTQNEAPDSMTPEEARAYLGIIAQSKGLSIDQGTIDKWVAQLPAHVNREIVEAFANRFAREIIRKGDAGMFDVADRIAIPSGSTAEDLGLVPDEKDPEHFGHVPQDGMYQAWVDNQGVVKKFTPGGKEPVDATAKEAAKQAAGDDKRWSKLDDVVNGAFKTRSGGLGSLATAVFRAVRAINTLKLNPDLTSQDLANVAQDVAGIFQGGAPTVVTAQDNNYSLTLLGLANWFRAQTGIMAKVGHLFGQGNSPLEPTRRKLLEVCTQLRDSAIVNLQKFILSEEPAYRDLIQRDIQNGGTKWADFQKKKEDFIESGIGVFAPYSPSDPSYGVSPLNITGANEAFQVKDPNAKPMDTGAGNQDKKDALRKKLGLLPQGN